MTTFISVFESHIRDGLSNSYPGTEGSAEFLAQMHLSPKNFAMPIFTANPKEVVALLKDGKFKETEQKLAFEKTQTMRGIIRVLVRTHLNRQGVGHVSRGAQDKTLANRVLLPFEGDFDYEALLDPQSFADCWQKSIDDHDELYDDIDKASILGLRKLKGKQWYSSNVARHFGIHDNWAKVLTGIYTGLRFLSEEYQFDSRRLWQEMEDCAGDAKASQKLVKKVQNNIHQYGMALAGSFLADLGHSRFVKPDTHVVSSVAALYNQASISQQRSVEQVYRLSKQFNMPPRMLDKIFYIGCSGKLYLSSLEMKNPRQFKSSFLQKLRDSEYSIQ